MSKPLIYTIATNDENAFSCSSLLIKSLKRFLKDDFDFNPVIKIQRNKQININNLNSEINNPYFIFCYTHRVKELSKKIHLFKNNFALVTHNSDGEIRYEPEILNILNCPKLDKWYSQNICIENPKLHFLPIGLAPSKRPDAISFPKTITAEPELDSDSL